MGFSNLIKTICRRNEGRSQVLIFFVAIQQLSISVPKSLWFVKRKEARVRVSGGRHLLGALAVNTLDFFETGFGAWIRGGTFVKCLTRARERDPCGICFVCLYSFFLFWKWWKWSCRETSREHCVKNRWCDPRRKCWFFECLMSPPERQWKSPSKRSTSKRISSVLATSSPNCT